MHKDFALRLLTHLLPLQDQPSFELVKTLLTGEFKSKN